MAPQQRIDAVVIGSSAGGMHALGKLLGGLDVALPVPVICVNHSGASDTRVFCDILARTSTLPVVEAQERMPIRPGVVHIAPSGYHLLVEQSRRFALSVDRKVGFSRPSIDVLFHSAADVWDSSLMGIVLTGANSDGAEGLRRIRQRGGLGIVQDPRSAESPVMPKAALTLAGADHCLELEAIAPLLNSLVCQR